MLSMHGHVSKSNTVYRPNRIRFKKSRITGPWDRKDSVSEKENEKKFMLVYL